MGNSGSSAYVLGWNTTGKAWFKRQLKESIRAGDIIGGARSAGAGSRLGAGGSSGPAAHTVAGGAKDAFNRTGSALGACQRNRFFAVYN